MKLQKIVFESGSSTDRLLDVKEVCAITGTCRSWVHAKTSARMFPQPIRLGPRFTRWKSCEISAWVADPFAWIAANAGAQQ